MAAPKLGARGLRSTSAPPTTPPSTPPPSSGRKAIATAHDADATSKAAGKGSRRPVAPVVSIMGDQMASSRGAESRLQETRDVARWPIDEVERDPTQPRTEFDPAEIDALARDIARRGLDKPIDLREEQGRKLIVDGERRWRAYKLLHQQAPNDDRWKDIPARLLPPDLTPDEIRLRQLAASLHHLPYSAIDYARKLAEMADLAVQAGKGETRTTTSVVLHLAEQLSRGDTWVRRHLYLAEGLEADQLRQLQQDRPSLPLNVLEEVVRAFRKAGPLLTDDLRASILGLAVTPANPAPGRASTSSGGGHRGEEPDDASNPEPSYHSAETLRRLYGRMVGRAAGRGKAAKRVVSGARREVIGRDGIQLEYQLAPRKMRSEELDRLAAWLRAKAEEVERIRAELAPRS